MGDKNETVSMKKGKGGSNQYCAVPGCRTLRKREPDISFFRFPQEGKGTVRVMNKYGVEESVDRFKVWKGILNIKQISKSTVICSKHFLISDYILYDPKMKKPRLKRIAVPSQNLANNPSAKKTHNKYVLMQETDECEEHEEYKLFTANAFLQKCNLSPVKEASFSSQIASDAQLNTLTGLHKLQLLNNLVEVFNKHEEPPISALSTKDRIVLTFIKLKHAVSFSVLSTFFNISASSCRKHFLKTISKLAVILSPAVSWPSGHKKNLPGYFQDFVNVKVILDCVEVHVHTQNCPYCPHPPHQESVKVISGISPESLIIFTSRASGSSHKTLFEDNSQVLWDNLGVFDDCFMADKGFVVDAIAHKHNIKLVRPELFQVSEQFTEHQRNYNINVKKMQVHSERINARFRVFNILGSFPKSLQCVFDDVFIVICAVVNLQSSSMGIDL